MPSACRVILLCGIVCLLLQGVALDPIPNLARHMLLDSSSSALQPPLRQNLLANLMGTTPATHSQSAQLRGGTENPPLIQSPAFLLRPVNPVLQWQPPKLLCPTTPPNMLRTPSTPMPNIPFRKARLLPNDGIVWHGLREQRLSVCRMGRSGPETNDSDQEPQPDDPKDADSPPKVQFGPEPVGFPRPARSFAPSLMPTLASRTKPQHGIGEQPPTTSEQIGRSRMVLPDGVEPGERSPAALAAAARRS